MKLLFIYIALIGITLFLSLISTFPYSIFLFLGSITLLIIFSFFKRKIVIFPFLSIFFGGMSIIIAFGSASIWFDYSKIGILGVGTLFLVGIFTILPLHFFKNFSIRMISYLISISLILLVIFTPFLLIKIPGGYHGDWQLIPFVIWDSLLFGLFCLPFLIIKSRRAMKLPKNEKYF